MVPFAVRCVLACEVEDVRPLGLHLVVWGWMKEHHPHGNMPTWRSQVCRVGYGMVCGVSTEDTIAHKASAYKLYITTNRYEQSIINFSPSFDARSEGTHGVALPDTLRHPIN